MRIPQTPQNELPKARISAIMKPDCMSHFLSWKWKCLHCSYGSVYGKGDIRGFGSSSLSSVKKRGNLVPNDHLCSPFGHWRKKETLQIMDIRTSFYWEILGSDFLIIMALLLQNNIQSLNHTRQYTGYRLFFHTVFPVMDNLKELNLLKEFLWRLICRQDLKFKSITNLVVQSLRKNKFT